MINPVKPVADASSSTPDFTGQDAKPQSTPATTAMKQTAPATPPEESLRLVIEPTSGGESYTYKLFDRATGALLIELPRDVATKMSESPDYSAGQVYSAKA